MQQGMVDKVVNTAGTAPLTDSPCIIAKIVFTTGDNLCMVALILLIVIVRVLAPTIRVLLVLARIGETPVLLRNRFPVHP